MFANLFTLTETTLLYHDISTFRLKKTSYGTIEDWASHVPVARPSSHKLTPVPTVSGGSSKTAVPASHTTSNLSAIAITVNDATKAKKRLRSSQPLRSGLKLREDKDMFKDKSVERSVAMARAGLFR
jgi:hypothetical protein